MASSIFSEAAFQGLQALHHVRVRMVALGIRSQATLQLPWSCSAGMAGPRGLAAAWSHWWLQWRRQLRPGMLGRWLGRCWDAVVRVSVTVVSLVSLVSLVSRVRVVSAVSAVSVVAVMTVMTVMTWGAMILAMVAVAAVACSLWSGCELLGLGSGPDPTQLLRWERRKAGGPHPPGCISFFGTEKRRGLLQGAS